MARFYSTSDKVLRSRIRIQDIEFFSLADSFYQIGLDCDLKEADLITEKKQQERNGYYSVDKKRTMEVIEFFEDVYDYKLSALKEYVENKEKKKEVK